ncbi:hypothetical protein NW766_005942 [Fusarium irregulare]|uniref:Uncharacterized protein n=1 Tax=Fusarium irregulare TaxID=2494466 RepID=A0A9W8PQE7_9HYPO|nr:hypothetical protein NW766_005942 [Fusarium irregulare]
MDLRDQSVKATIVLCCQYGRTNHVGRGRDNSEVLSGPNTRHRKRKAAELQAEAEVEAENSNKEAKSISKTRQKSAGVGDEELGDAPPA